ncbi:2-polyprenylphenol 6-hydroxylase [Xanthomonas cucurbitae]|uniref:2-polyprenylphenol 6-hydroxylase n=1 Tax=Xanthomonas cucurbitae TaxID=56453 RepID=A0A2S7DYN8_9XANT|nr:2-polyprenylphenol 6-hydroxylase [Xanthomonas cucurbitae]PPU78839.1 2-polyprenylphenol 6-hydroxylase [Xanthomonas cucurbitae]WDM69182.1 2-polyprenylphenol 6-hydroxylase [Xanthomonas cucurbitae]WDM73053.1 2-polyprenylphenol 6-hydroxylase [Xanthomonas cucurbitae]WDM77791.1 2-polyprenylphenol 6-hydroxylase [Xanthomonas cucurbitae]WDM81467.1 2-polyprenylphenol 6-hydroxylase [Xanthomonas cucurbitae]
MWEALGTVRDLGRLQEIAAVLIRYGFGDIVRRIGLADVLERAGKLLQWGNAEGRLRMSAAMRVRRALEELGPTFVKLGQVLATRVDLLPPDWIDELSELQNAVPALPFAQVLPQLVAALGAEPDSVFARLDEQPLAAASLAQTHRAWLADGTPVVLKIRRPGIGDTIEADLRLLARLADIVETRAPDLKRYRPAEVVQQFTVSLRRELDFAAECRNAERIAADFAHDPQVVVPAVYWQWTCESLNVQDFIDGIPGRDLQAVDAAGLDRKALARAGAGIVLKMVLQNGCFHADPHPGNIFYLRDGRIAVIDFGMVGRVSEQRRFQVAQLLHGMVSQDAEAVIDVLLEWAGASLEIDEPRLQQDIGAFIDQYRGVPLKELRIGAMLGDVTAILRDHSLPLPSDLALMIKAFLTLEGMGRQLDPDFDMATEAQPYLERVVLQRYAPNAMLRRGRRTVTGAIDLIGDLPRDLKRLIQAARRGKLQLQVETRALREFGEQVDRAANRLTMGIVTAALVIGSSIVMNSVGGSASRWLLGLGVSGFIGAGLCGIWILFSIWRSRR